MQPSTTEKQGSAPSAGTEEGMARASTKAPIVDLTGWKDIASHLAMSVKFAMRASMLEDDPLPVFKLGRTVAANSAELNAWVERRRRHAPTASGPTLRLVTATG